MTPPAETPFPPRLLPWLTAALLILGLAAYLPAFSGTLLFDDIPLLRGYDCWHGLARIPSMLTFDESNPCAYRPGRWVTFALDWTLAGGLSPLWLHVSSFLYHLGTAFCVFLLLRRFASPLAALTATGLWLLHPVQTDSVAYISGRRDIVSTLLFVAALLLVLRPAGQRLRLWGALGALLLFFLAVQTKEMAVTLPVIAILGGLLLAADGGRARQHLRRFWPAYAGLMLLATAFVGYRAFLHPHSLMAGHWWGGSPVSNFATTFALHARYLQLWLWPSPLIGDYYPETIRLAANFADPRTLLGIGLDVAMLGLAWLALRRGWRVTAFGLAWYLVTLLPVSHLIPHHELFAEHYLYLPSIGLCLAVLPVLEWVVGLPRRAGLGVGAALAGVLVAWTAVAADRSGELRDELTFYRAAHQRAPRNLRALHYLGVVLAEQGECDEALPVLREAAQAADPETDFGRDERAATLLCSDRLGRREGVDATIDELLAGHPQDPFGLAWRGRRHLEEGRAPEAVADLSAAVEAARGRDGDAVAMLALALNRSGAPDRALALLRQYPQTGRVACEQEVLAHVSLGVTHYDQAFRRVNECLGQFPESVFLLEWRGSLFASMGRPDEAAADLRRLEALQAPADVLERLRALLPQRP